MWIIQVRIYNHHDVNCNFIANFRKKYFEYTRSCWHSLPIPDKKVYLQRYGSATIDPGQWQKNACPEQAEEVQALGGLTGEELLESAIGNG